MHKTLKCHGERLGLSKYLHHRHPYWKQKNDVSLWMKRKRNIDIYVPWSIILRTRRLLEKAVVLIPWQHRCLPFNLCCRGCKISLLYHYFVKVALCVWLSALMLVSVYFTDVLSVTGNAAFIVFHPFLYTHVVYRVWRKFTGGCIKHSVFIIFSVLGVSYQFRIVSHDSKSFTQ